MVRGTSTQWNAVEQWSATLFLVCGTLFVGHAAVQGIEAFTNLPPPPDVFVTTGHLIALVGLAGLYPVLRDRTPKAKRTAIVVAVVPLVGWVVMTGAKLFTVAGMVSSLTDSLPGAVITLVVGSMILTYVLFGVATLRVGEGSRTVGLLVRAPAALIVVLLADAAVTGASAVDGVFIGGGLALPLLALGYPATASIGHTTTVQCLAVYVDGALTEVFPHTACPEDSGETYTVQDALAVLKAHARQAYDATQTSDRLPSQRPATVLHTADSH